MDTILPTDRGGIKSSVKILSDMEANVVDPKAKAQLDVLCRLIGKSTLDAPQKNKSFNDFKLNLFNNDDEEL